MMQLRLILPVLAAACVVTYAGIADAKVIIKERTKYYRVSGKTGKQIYTQMQRKGPRIGRSKQHYVATATINFRIRNIDGYEWGRQCVIRNLDIIVDVTYRIPKWKRPKGASRELVSAWDAFLAHVWRHEKRHTAIAKDSAYELWRALKGVKGKLEDKCKNMASLAAKRAKRVYRRHDQKQDRFDTSTFGDGGRQFRHDRRLRAAK